VSDPKQDAVATAVETEVFLPSGDRYAMDALLEKAEREKAERNRVERRAESGLHFVGSVKAPKQAAAWAERMILSGRSCSVHAVRRAVSVTRGEASPPGERMALPDEGGRRG